MKGVLDLVAERQFSKSFNLKNELQLAYGQTAKQSADPNRPDRVPLFIHSVAWPFAVHG